MTKPKIEMICKECREPQPIDKEQSNENWSFYDTKEKCECGGKFGMCMDGEFL